MHPVAAPIRSAPVDLSDWIGAARQRKAHDNTRKEKRHGETEREFSPGDKEVSDGEAPVTSVNCTRIARLAVRAKASVATVRS